MKISIIYLSNISKYSHFLFYKLADTKSIHQSDSMSFCKLFKSSILVGLATSVAAARIGSSGAVTIEQERQQPVDDTTAFVQCEQDDLDRAVQLSLQEQQRQASR